VAPVLTLLAGWSFKTRQWELNDFTNSLVHVLIGGAITQIAGRPATAFVAVGVEVWQFFHNDAMDPKLEDRIRDAAFYLVL
jgi:hypothetical protein